MPDEVLVEHADGVTLITLNRPSVRNAVNRAVSTEWPPRWTSSAADRDKLRS